jgi:hypothetical protein
VRKVRERIMRQSKRRCDVKGQLLGEQIDTMLELCLLSRFVGVDKREKVRVELWAVGDGGDEEEVLCRVEE